MKMILHVDLQKKKFNTDDLFADLESLRCICDCNFDISGAMFATEPIEMHKGQNAEIETGNHYYFIESDGMINCETWCNTVMDKRRQKFGNAFATSAQAKAALDMITEVLK